MTSRIGQFVLLAGPLLAGGSALAGSPEDQPIDPPGPADHSGGLWAWVQLVLAMLLVVGLVFALQWLLKRLGGPCRQAARGELEVITRLPLGGRNHLALVKLGRRVLLLGVGGQGPVTLCDVSDPDEAADVLHAAGKESTFEQTLADESGQQTTSPEDAE